MKEVVRVQGSRKRKEQLFNNVDVVLKRFLRKALFLCPVRTIILHLTYITDHLEYLTSNGLTLSVHVLKFCIMSLVHQNPLLLFSMPGGGELIIILVVVLLLFGGRKIPELMRGLGKGIREFNDAKTNVTKELEEGMKEKDITSPASRTSTTTQP